MKSPLQKIEYDKTVDALYIRAGKGKVYKTIKLNNRVLFDVDKKGYILGIEVLEASQAWKIPQTDRIKKFAIQQA